jgi:hypothetical protein
MSTPDGQYLVHTRLFFACGELNEVFQKARASEAHDDGRVGTREMVSVTSIGRFNVAGNFRA